MRLEIPIERHAGIARRNPGIAVGGHQPVEFCGAAVEEPWSKRGDLRLLHANGRHRRSKRKKLGVKKRHGFLGTVGRMGRARAARVNCGLRSPQRQGYPRSHAGERLDGSTPWGALVHSLVTGPYSAVDGELAAGFVGYR